LKNQFNWARLPERLGCFAGFFEKKNQQTNNDLKLILDHFSNRNNGRIVDLD